ncbi:hypothetical protein ABW19_dt0209293 [Dactylella cylindrospora]|nr:hypothetical protein ABW19_dt0209293 [Dactylella cylindrospora]
MAPLVEADSHASKANTNNNNLNGTTNNTLPGAPAEKANINSNINNGSNNKDSNDFHSKYSDPLRSNIGVGSNMMPYSAPSSAPAAASMAATSNGATERPTISLITGVSPIINKSASSLSSNPSSALVTPSTAASTITTGGLQSASPASSMEDKHPRLPNLSSSLGEKPGHGPLPSLSTPSSAHSSSLPSFHHHHHTPMFPPRGNPPSQSLSSPFPSPDVISSRRDEFLPRPFSTYPPNVPPPSSSASFGDSELDEDGRSRKRYGRPPGAKDKRPRRRRTKAQMEEDALIYGYRDSESVYHSPTSLAKRRRLSPRRNSIEGSPEEGSSSPPPQSSYTYPAYNSFLLATRPPNTKEPFPSVPQSTQPSPTNNFNPFLHRHHLPVSTSNAPSTLPSLRPPEHMSSARPNSDSPWPPRPTEPERMPGSQIPDSRPGAGDFGPPRYPPSPVGPTGFSSINAGRPSEAFRPPPPPPHGDPLDRRGRDRTPRNSPPPEYRRERDVRWEAPAPLPTPVPLQGNTLPRLGELPRLSDLPLDRPRWDRPEDLARKSEYDHRSAGPEKKLHPIPSLASGHILNGAPPMDPNTAQRKPNSPPTTRPAFSDILRPGPETPITSKPPQVNVPERPLLQERSGSITNITVGPVALEADTTKREEEDTDEQIEEYRTRMLEQHSSYYNGTSGKPRVKREPSYAMPSKSPLQEENERLRAALQRYRQQKGIEKLKLEEFINKRCNGDQAMIKELLTITGHITEDEYVGPVKPACL